jgi:hypothetical protein
MTDDHLPTGLHPDDDLADPAFDELFTALREAGRLAAPPVQPALAALLTGGVAPRRRRGARGATVGLAVVGVLAGGVGAAAATGHLEVRPPAVTRVADRTTQAPVTAEPGDQSVDLGVTAPAATAHEAPEASDPDDVLDLRTDAGPPTGSDASRDGDSAASDEASSPDDDSDDDGDDGGDEAQVPASADVDDDHSGDDGGHSGKGGGGDDGSSGSGDVTNQDGADRAG